MNDLFPTVMGLTWPIKRREEFNTIIQKAASAKEVRWSNWSNPIWHWELKFSYLKDTGTAPTALRTLMNFYSTHGGCLYDFLFEDTSDNTAAYQPSLPYTTNGTNRRFQLARQLANEGDPTGRVESIWSPHVIEQVLLDNVPQVGNWSHIGNGLIEFASAPSTGKTFSWNGSYYWRVRFEDDIQEFTRTREQLWEDIVVKLVSIKVM